MFKLEDSNLCFIEQDPVKINLANNLRALRLYHNLTQDYVANYLSIDRSSYTYYENNRIRPRYENLIKLGNLYSVPIISLLLDDLSII